MNYQEKWEQLKEMLVKEINRLEEKEEYRQRDMFCTEGQIKQTKFILSEMEKIIKS
jgi:hypothetical protein